MRRAGVKQLAGILPLLLVLGACGSDSDRSSAGDNSASGEVLEGSISDAMLPLDTVQSQSPPLEIPRAEKSSSNEQDAEKPEQTAEEAGPAPEAVGPAPEEE